MHPSTPLPLAGFTAVELTDNASAPFAGEILAQLGAEVWKVERPGGDASRRWGFERWRGACSSYHVLNRGKRALCLDVKNADELAQLHRLIDEKADVFIHNLRPGTSGQYQLDAETLRGRKPSLVYCEVGAFGHAGPLREEPGYDPLMQAFSGIMSLTGEADRPPSRAGVSIIDLGTGTWAALGIITALLRRNIQGAGATVNCSLFETSLAWMALSLGTAAAGGRQGERLGSGISFIAPSRAYMAADGYLMLSCANDALFTKLCDALGHAHAAKGADGAPMKLVHRDISPSNILISRAGEVKLTDFGIAKRAEEQTGIGGVRGKFAYISPEQARNEHLDPRSDVFSAAIVLWELLTGRPLYSAMSDLDALRGVRDGEALLTTASRWPKCAITRGTRPRTAASSSKSASKWALAPARSAQAATVSIASWAEAR